MMERITVTVTDLEKSFKYDFEIPLNTEFGQIKGKILSALFMMDPAMDFGNSPDFVDTRNGARLLDQKTAGEAGVWNGDYIIVVAR